MTKSDRSVGGVKIYDRITRDIREVGYSVEKQALPRHILQDLVNYFRQLPSQKLKKAGVGRAGDHIVSVGIRGDNIYWINGEFEAGRAWLVWANQLQEYVNRRLYLGLFSFESHFASYAPGSFYKKHRDAFYGQSNRKLSLIVYLNTDWEPEDGGELLVYSADGKRELVRVLPELGTLVVFLSEEFPHEVLPATRQRLSIAGWYHVNTSSQNRINPPNY